MSTDACTSWKYSPLCGDIVRLWHICDFHSDTCLLSIKILSYSVNYWTRTCRPHVLHWLEVADRIRFRLCVQVLKVNTAWLLDTWPDLSPASTDIGICDLLAVASLTFHELDCQHTNHAHSVMLDRLLGTLFLSVWRTMHCLCLTLGTSSNISTSCPTSTPITLVVFLQLTC